MGKREVIIGKSSRGGGRRTTGSNDVMLMPPSGTEFVPVGREITLIVGHMLVGSVVVNLGALVKNADVGTLGIDPVHKSLVVIWLTGPHPVLNVPVENPQGFFLGFGGTTNRLQNQDGYNGQGFQGIGYRSHFGALFEQSYKKKPELSRLRKKRESVLLSGILI